MPVGTSQTGEGKVTTAEDVAKSITLAGTDIENSDNDRKDYIDDDGNSRSCVVASYSSDAVASDLKQILVDSDNFEDHVDSKSSDGFRLRLY